MVCFAYFHITVHHFHITVHHFQTKKQKRNLTHFSVVSHADASNVKELLALK